MSPESSSRARSMIVKVPDATPGLLFVNGEQKSFTLEGVWKSPVAPVVNMSVDVDLDGAGAITAITVVDAQQHNKERLNELSGVAQEKGKEAAKLTQQGVGALAARMGTVPLVAAVVLWIAWFFFPAATISGGMVGSMSFTFWTLLGIDFSSMSGLTGSSSAGALSFLGIIAIAAPFAAPFIKAAWSKYLNAAPLGFFLIAFLVIYMGESKVFGGQIMGMSIPNPFSWSWGLYIIGLAALVLASGALKKSA